MAGRKESHGWARTLVALGVGLLIASFLGVNVWAWAWPLIVLGPGLLLFGMVKEMGKGAAWLTVPATMISAVGLLLFYQNLTGHWASWAYAWPLIMPGALGMGLAVYGDLARKKGMGEAGEKLAKIGAGLFIGFAIFFELLVGISGLGWLWPLLLVGMGLYFLRRRKRRRHIIRPRAVGTRPNYYLEEELDPLSEIPIPDQRERSRVRS